jgi:hypothetical protein
VHRKRGERFDATRDPIRGRFLERAAPGPSTAKESTPVEEHEPLTADEGAVVADLWVARCKGLAGAMKPEFLPAAISLCDGAGLSAAGTATTSCSGSPTRG